MDEYYPSQYVVLRHEQIAEPHFDLMMEVGDGDTLMTFRSLVWPLHVDAMLEKLEDHRRDYLHYEGPVSAGRGFVKRVARGECSVGWGGNYSYRSILVAFKDEQPIGYWIRQVDALRWRVHEEVEITRA